MFDPFNDVADLSTFKAKVTRDISEFLEITEKPFSYRILDEESEEVLYESNPLKLHF